ncbi:Mini-ribonuclease 3 [uncultured Ruthenibacterium sp.]|uniref:Mini-ribonuclease 3 n=1 Tax=uncultured Ruthenibacterium sp. TaxID=1905347 RepID=UPI00349EFD62
MLFEPQKGDKVDIREQSPLSLAFVGDGVYEVLVRARLVEYTRLVPNQLHRHAVRFVCARGQYQALKALIPLLSEEEASVVRRGKNASKATVAKHATAQEYRASTALEALFGWLYLRGEEERIYQLFDVAWNAIEAAEQPE